MVWHFLSYRACWQRSYYILFSTTKVKCTETHQQKDQPEDVGGTFTRSSTSRPEKSRSCNVFFLCDKTDNRKLCNASTLPLDTRVRQCAVLLNDEKLLAKLSSGDLIAYEAVYHWACVSKLYRYAVYALHEEREEGEAPHRLEGIASAGRIRSESKSHFRRACVRLKSS